MNECIQPRSIDRSQRAVSRHHYGMCFTEPGQKTEQESFCQLQMKHDLLLFIDVSPAEESLRSPHRHQLMSSAILSLRKKKKSLLSTAMEHDKASNTQQPESAWNKNV